MIRKCNEADIEILNNYLYKRKELNLFVIGDIENYGFNNTNLEIFIDYDNRVRTIYLRFFNNLCVVSYELFFDLSFIKELINKYSIRNISGEKDLLDLISLDDFALKPYFFASIDKLDLELDTSNVIELNKTHVPQLLEKTNKIFDMDVTAPESLILELENKSKHIYAILEGDEIISSASSSAESKELAMVVAVFTLEGYRQQGYALKCVYALCNRLIKEGKTVCLFYDNPHAAKLYEKIGFKFKGYFSSLRKLK
ncbi:MAG: GNAT family N-acetyltransferase [Spirochaetia bacterium]|nr:GNAT family N-acetyltransferase [Spirochaetia bacterium]